MTKSLRLKVEISPEEKENLVFNTEVLVAVWKGTHATYWEPASDGGYEVTKVTVQDVNGKLQRARFPKLFKFLDGFVADMIETNSDVVDDKMQREEEDYEMDYEGWGS